MTREAHVVACETCSTWSKDFSQRNQTTERHEDRWPPSDVGRPGADHTVVLETTDELQWQSIPQTRQRSRRRPLIYYCCPDSPWTERPTDQRAKEKPILTHTADHVVVNRSDEEPKHLPRTSELVNYHKLELEEATSEDRTETASQPEEPVMKRSQRKRQSQSKWSMEAKNLDDDE